jgi:hypothetical protein
MSKWQYVGDAEAPKSIVFRGHAFSLKGAYVEITDPETEAKLEGIRGFRKQSPEQAKLKPKAAPKAAPKKKAK